MSFILLFCFKKIRIFAKKIVILFNRVNTGLFIAFCLLFKHGCKKSLLFFSEKKLKSNKNFY